MAEAGATRTQRDLRWPSFVVLGIAGGMGGVAFFRAPGWVKALAVAIGLAMLVGIALVAMPPWQGTHRQQMKLLALSLAVGAVLIPVSLVFGR